jgi:hypothetical protein
MPALYRGETVLSDSYQHRVEEWLTACFPAAVRTNRQERTHRFLEEALELAQANGCSREHAMALVDYVYSRPEGRPELEVGACNGRPPRKATEQF